MTRLLAVAVLSALALTGCASVDEPRGATAFEAGRAYGQELAQSPRLQNPAHLLAACTKSIKDSRVRDLRTGEYTKETNYVDAEFIDGCTDAANVK